MTKAKAISRFCSECAGGQSVCRTLCTAFDRCPLWPYRAWMFSASQTVLRSDKIGLGESSWRGGGDEEAGAHSGPLFNREAAEGAFW